MENIILAVGTMEDGVVQGYIRDVLEVEEKTMYQYTQENYENSLAVKDGLVVFHMTGDIEYQSFVKDYIDNMTCEHRILCICPDDDILCEGFKDRFTTQWYPDYLRVFGVHRRTLLIGSMERFQHIVRKAFDWDMQVVVSEDIENTVFSREDVRVRKDGVSFKLSTDEYVFDDCFSILLAFSDLSLCSAEKLKTVRQFLTAMEGRGDSTMCLFHTTENNLPDWVTDCFDTVIDCSDK